MDVVGAHGTAGMKECAAQAPPNAQAAHTKSAPLPANGKMQEQMEIMTAMISNAAQQ